MFDTAFEVETIRNDPHEVAAVLRVLDAHGANDVLEMLGID